MSYTQRHRRASADPRPREHRLEGLEPRIVLDGDWSALPGAEVYGSVNGGFLTVTTIDLDNQPIVFQQENRGDDDFGSDSWAQLSMLTTDDGSSNGTNFETLGRHSLAIHDDWLVIGAPNANSGAGAAAVYRQDDAGAWTFETLITAPGLEPGDGFGWSVDMYGEVIVVGSRLGNAAYVFQNTGTWELETTLTPTVGQDGRFGFSVATDGAVIVVGAPGEETLDEDFTGTSGAVYIYDRDGAAWALAERIEAPESALNSEFGHAVAVQANTVAVGAWLDDDRGEGSGSVFAYGRHAGDWVMEIKLIPDAASPGARFGYDVATSGSRIGAVAIGSNNGAVLPWAQVFKRDGDDWSLETTLAPDSGGGDFGWRSIAFDSDRVIVGSDADGGTATVFRMSDGNEWELEIVLEPTAANGATGMGFDVAADGSDILLGGLVAPGSGGGTVAVEAGMWLFVAPFDSDVPDAEKKWVVGSFSDLPVGEATTDAITWTDPKDGRTYAAVGTADGVVLLTLSADRTTWTARNLTGEITGSEAITRGISAFGTRDGLVYIVGYNAENEMVAYRQSGAGSAGAYDWSFKNITVEDLDPQGRATPQFTSKTVTWVTSWNALNIAGLDEDGRVQAIWIAPGMQQWFSSDLSASSGAPTLSGELTVFVTSWNAMNIAGVDSDGALTVTWWVPGFAKWVVTDFNERFGGPAIDPSSVAAYTTPWGALNVVGRDDRGDLIVYWWVPAFSDPPENNFWRVTNLSSVLLNSTVGEGAVTSLVTEDGQINLFATNATNDVIRFVWEQGDRWRVEDLTHGADIA
ncbi:MAG TPA: hypothetical protein VFF69_15110 [Phycisphaerales bacterium]|nr:hypothetical protein [Phycisphaerales bacterium]